MIPLCLHKEQPGYLLNTMMVPLLNSGLYLWANDIADPETIDLTWRVGTGASMGPFQFCDVIGITTVYNVVAINPEANKPGTVHYLIKQKLQPMIDAGHLGRATGEGFYKYN